MNGMTHGSPKWWSIVPPSSSWRWQDPSQPALSPTAALARSIWPEYADEISLVSRVPWDWVTQWSLNNVLNQWWNKGERAYLDSSSAVERPRLGDCSSVIGSGEAILRWPALAFEKPVDEICSSRFDLVPLFQLLFEVEADENGRVDHRELDDDMVVEGRESWARNFLSWTHSRRLWSV